jgi:hypothetical protein
MQCPKPAIVVHLKSNGIPSEPYYFNVKNNELTSFAAYTARYQATKITLVSTDSIIRGGDSQHSCGEGECSDENGFEMHSTSHGIVIKMKEMQLGWYV